MDYGGDMQHDEHPLDHAGGVRSGRLYDPDGHFDSSSSSGSDNHSSPADSSYTATSQHNWALDGLSLDLALPWSPGAPSSLAALDPGFSHVLSSKQIGGRDHHKGHSVEPLTLPHDFWDASAPLGDSRQVSATHGADTAAFHSLSGEAEPAAPTTDGSVEASHTASGDGMQMDFDDMVHGDVCGYVPPQPPPDPRSGRGGQPSEAKGADGASAARPATLSSSPHPELPAGSASSGITAQLAQDNQHASFSMPIDLLAVNAGIAPSLTNVDGSQSGQATPDRFASPAPESLISPRFASTRATSVSSTTPQQTEATSDLYGLRRSSTTTRSSRASTREHSVSRASDTSTSSSSAAQQQRAAKAASKQTTSSSAFLGAGAVNLVARDAVLAAKLIPQGAAPSADELVAAANTHGSGPAPELLILGIPTVGAKSRVETQIKISLALVRPQHAIKREDGIDVDRKVGYVSIDGGLDTSAAKDLERIETWSHLRLPKHLALKSKEKKGPGVVKPKPAVPVPEPPVESILNLEVAVVSASDPKQQIHICSNCEQRELKRSLRRKDAKGKTFTAPIPEPDPNDPPRNEAEERSKVVVFNAQEIVDFKTGEVILPTRVTCYCRHHKEKKGFCITYAVRDHRGHLVARGMSPAIMITDDHKTNTSKAAAAAAAAAASANASAAEDAGPKRKGSKSATTSKGKKEKAVSASASASSSSGRPRRGVSGRSRRGQTDSDDEQDASRKSRPYDSDARPSRKRSANQHRSPMFAMTPLAPASLQASKPPSPILPAGSPNLPLSAVPQGDGFSSALGLDGLGDAGDEHMAAAPASFSDSRRYSTCEDAIDWRAGLSTPPLSPGSSAPSVAETFHSIFSGFPSPNPALQEARALREPSVPGSGSIPSFAIPATEPIPASFAPSWSLQQQPQQVNPPAAPPRINRVIPGEGPVHGGIEVTVLGDNFVRDLTCVFGDNAAVPTHYWSANTLVCVLPPSANPGPVVVGIKGVPLTPDHGAGLQLFTYKDTSDRSLLELALQVVGMQMTGRIEDAAAIAMRIVANGSGSKAGGSSGSAGHAPPQGGPSDTAALAATLETATRSAYATPSGSQASSRRSSFNALVRPALDSRSTHRSPLQRETRNFEGIVIKFLSLLDLDPSSIPGAAPSLPAAQPPISLVNQQRHTLLHLAAVLGFHRLVNFLLTRGIALDTADRNGYTALHFAALYGRVTIARLLVDSGANTAARTLAGQTPLDIAIEKDDIDVEDLLVSRGVEPSAAAVTPTLAASSLSRQVSEHSHSSAGIGSPRSVTESRRSSIASTQSRSSFFFEAAEDDSDSGTDYPSDWTVDHDSWDENDEADGEESEQELTPIPRSRLASRNASSASLQHLVATEGEAASERASPRLRKAHLSEIDGRDAAVPYGQPVDRSGAAEALPSSWLSQKLRPTAEGVSTAWEKAKATRFGVPSMQLTDVGNALHLGSARRRRATESAVHEDTDGNESTSTATSRFAASPFRDWTPAFRTPQWWHSSGKTPSSPPPQYTAADSLALAPPPEKLQPSEIAQTRPMKAQTDSFRAIRARVKRRLSSTSHSTDDTDAETDGGSAAFDAHRPASLWADVMLFAFWIPVLVAVLWYAYRNWAEYGRPVVAGLTETLMPARIGRIWA